MTGQSPQPDQIRELRESLALTQQEAARLCCVNIRSYRRWELGERHMPAGTWQLFKFKMAALKGGGEKK